MTGIEKYDRGRVVVCGGQWNPALEFMDLVASLDT